MDEVFFPTEEHQALWEPMTLECVRSAPVGLFPLPEKWQKPAAAYLKLVYLLPLYERWQKPISTAPPTSLVTHE